MLMEYIVYNELDEHKEAQIVAEIMARTMERELAALQIRYNTLAASMAYHVPPADTAVAKDVKDVIVTSIERSFNGEGNGSMPPPSEVPSSRPATTTAAEYKPVIENADEKYMIVDLATPVDPDGFSVPSNPDPDLSRSALVPLQPSATGSSQPSSVPPRAPSQPTSVDVPSPTANPLKRPRPVSPLIPSDPLLPLPSPSAEDQHVRSRARLEGPSGGLGATMPTQESLIELAMRADEEEVLMRKMEQQKNSQESPIADTPHVDHEIEENAAPEPGYDEEMTVDRANEDPQLGLDLFVKELENGGTSSEFIGPLPESAETREPTLPIYIQPASSQALSDMDLGADSDSSQRHTPAVSHPIPQAELSTPLQPALPQHDDQDHSEQPPPLLTTEQPHAPQPQELAPHEHPTILHAPPVPEPPPPPASYSLSPTAPAADAAYSAPLNSSQLTATDMSEDQDDGSEAEPEPEEPIKLGMRHFPLAYEATRDGSMRCRMCSCVPLSFISLLVNLAHMETRVGNAQCRTKHSRCRLSLLTRRGRI
jgi:hypothetical protein